MLPKVKGLFDNTEASYLKLNASASIASWLARSLSVFVSFPLEYKATALYGQKKFTTQLNKSVNKNVTTGFISMYLNNVLFSATFWPIAETTKKFMRNKLGIEKEYYVMPLGAIVAGISCGALTYPFEFIKILKISYEDRYGGKSGMTILRDVYKTGGVNYLLAGKNLSSKICRF